MDKLLIQLINVPDAGEIISIKCMEIVLVKKSLCVQSAVMAGFHFRNNRFFLGGGVYGTWTRVSQRGSQG